MSYMYSKNERERKVDVTEMDNVMTSPNQRPRGQQRGMAGRRRDGDQSRPECPMMCHSSCTAPAQAVGDLLSEGNDRWLVSPLNSIGRERERDSRRRRHLIILTLSIYTHTHIIVMAPFIHLFSSSPLSLPITLILTDCLIGHQV